MRLFEFLRFLNEDKIDVLADKNKDKLLTAAGNDRVISSRFPRLLLGDNPNAAKEIMTLLTNSDPTRNNKYIRYILKLFLNGEFQYEDAERMHGALEVWDRWGHKAKNRDLLGAKEYNALDKLEDKVRELDAYWGEGGGQSQEAEPEAAEQKQMSKTKAHQEKAKHEGLEILDYGEDGTLYKVNNFEAARWVCKAFGHVPYSDNARTGWAAWCTKNESQWNYYSKQGPLYIFDANGKEAFQIHLESSQVKDRSDREDTPGALKYPTFTKFWNNIRESHVIPSIKRGEYNVAIRFTQKQGKRDLEIEKYIKKDPIGATEYSRVILKGRWPEAEATILKDPKAIERYATYHFQGERWPEAEPHLLKSTAVALDYAKRSFRDGERWPELEEAILNNRNDETAPEAAFKYSIDVIKDRWHEAEPVILTDPRQATVYHQKVWKKVSGPSAIEQRWAEFEEILINDFDKEGVKRESLIYSYDNKEYFEDGRWTALENVIYDKPVSAGWYAVAVLEKRWPKAEPYIIKSESSCSGYKDKFL